MKKDREHLPEGSIVGIEPELPNWLLRWIIRFGKEKKYAERFRNWAKLLEPAFKEVPKYQPRIVEKPAKSEKLGTYELHRVGRKLVIGCKEFVVIINMEVPRVEVLGTSVMLESRAWMSGNLYESRGLPTQFTNIPTIKDSNPDAESPKFSVENEPIADGSGRSITYEGIRVDISHSRKHVIAYEVTVMGKIKGEMQVWGLGKDGKGPYVVPERNILNVNQSSPFSAKADDRISH